MAKAKQTSITKKHITAICRAIRTGCPISVAASTAGINRTTLYHWRNRGKAQPTGIHGELVAAMARAADDFISDNLKNLQGHSKLTWQTSAWLLERRHPELFAKITDRREMDDLKKEVQAIRGEMAAHSIARLADDGK